MGIYVQSPAPVSDPDKAGHILWTFIAGIGFDPNKILSIFASHHPHQIAFILGRVHGTLSASMKDDLAHLLGFEHINEFPLGKKKPVEED